MLIQELERKTGLDRPGQLGISIAKIKQLQDGKENFTSVIDSQIER